MEEFITIIGLVGAFVLVLWLYIKLTMILARFLKRKSHHYIIPPAPEQDRDWKPIEINEYEKYIFAHRQSKEKIDEILEKELKNYSILYDIHFSEKEDWLIIKIDNIDFYNYHKLVMLLDSWEEKELYFAIGYCKHNSSSKSYVVRYDWDSNDSYLIGAFKNNKNFSIYIKNASKSKKGNISLSNDNILNFKKELDRIDVFSI